MTPFIAEIIGTFLLNFIRRRRSSQCSIEQNYMVIIVVG